MTTPTITKPGVYRLAHHAYHADPAPTPSLSSTIVRVLRTATPAHAREKHPRVATKFEPEHKEAFDIGTATHAFLLREPAHFVVVDSSSWTKKADQETRREAWAGGQIPLLRQQYEDAQERAALCRELLRAHEAFDAFDAQRGICELSIFWQEDNGVWCRCKPDWLPKLRRDGMIAYDYKSTAVLSAPEAWASRTAWDLGVHLQAAWYRRGIRKIFGIRDVRFRFVVQEVRRPWLLNVYPVPEDILDEAEAECVHAIGLWGRCLEAGEWPGYVPRLYPMQRPEWHQRRGEEIRQRQEEIGHLIPAAMEMQRPIGVDA